MMSQTRTFSLPTGVNPLTCPDNVVDEIVATSIHDDSSLVWEPQDIDRSPNGICVHALDIDTDEPWTINLTH